MLTCFHAATASSATAPTDPTAPAATAVPPAQTTTTDARSDTGNQTLDELVADTAGISTTESELLDIDAQIDAGELREARRDLEGRINNQQATGDRYDVALIEPLRLLGRVYHEQGEYPRAAETFARATQISRVAYGLHSEQQLRLVHMEIASLKAMSNLPEANKRHEYAFNIARRHYGRYAPELIPELLKIGAWYSATGDVMGARDRYSEARLLLSAQADSATSDDMIKVLRGIAQSFRDERYPPFYSRSDKETKELFESTGLYDRQTSLQEEFVMRSSINAFHRGSEALRDVVNIEGDRLLTQQQQLDAQAAALASVATTPNVEQPIDANQQANAKQQTNADNPEPATSDQTAVISQPSRRKPATVNLNAIAGVLDSSEVDKTDFLEAVLDLADWYLLMNKDSLAFAYYQQAWMIAERDPNTDANALLGRPSLLYFPRPRDPKIPELTPREHFKDGFVEVSFNVDHRGAVKKLRTVSSEPRGMMDFHVRSSAKIARYRPSIVDGLPQLVQTVSYRHDFNYYPRNRDEPAPPRQIDTDVASSEPVDSPGG